MSLGNGAWKDGGAQEQTKPSAGYPWQPCEWQLPRHRHTEKTVETQDTYHIFTMYHEAKGGWVGWK